MLSYREVGASREMLAGGSAPADYREVRRLSRVGAFAPVVTALRTWQVHRAAGVAVHAPGEPAPDGDVRLAILGLLRAPVRVIWVDESPDRYAFAYGTLAGHPESGEAAFEVRRDEDASWFAVAAFSRPVGLARWAAPISRLVQDLFNDRYARAAVRFGRDAVT